MENQNNNSKNINELTNKSQDSNTKNNNSTNNEAMNAIEEKYIDSLLVPKSRIAVIIGKKGSTKKRLQKELDVTLDINSHTGEITILGKDSLKVFTASNVIKAIARGFNPEIALQLINPDYMLELINIMDFVKTKNSLHRVKARVIGTQGKARKTIENLTNTNIVIFGKTVGIIGAYEDVEDAKDALITLIEGAPHSRVYRILEKKRKMKKIRKMLEFYGGESHKQELF